MMNSKGQSMIEYIIILVVISLGCLAVVKGIRSRMDVKLEHVRDEIEKLRQQ